MWLLILLFFSVLQTAVKTDFFETHTGLFSLNDQNHKLHAWCMNKLQGSAFTGVKPFESICQIEEYKEQYEETCAHDPSHMPPVIEQCIAEQKYVRGAMTRTLLYAQVSVSGQALVFVVRNQGWSLTQRAGNLTYIAFVLAQVSFIPSS